MLLIGRDPYHGSPRSTLSLTGLQFGLIAVREGQNRGTLARMAEISGCRKWRISYLMALAVHKRAFMLIPRPFKREGLTDASAHER
jgi:hypothetical protein